MSQFDMIIVGGGLVGAGLALSLQHANCRIALVDARLPTNDDPRLFALNSHSCDFLQRLQLWDIIAPYAAPIQQVHVSQRGHFGAVRLLHSDVNLSSLGHVIPAHHIETAMNHALARLANATSSVYTLFRPARVQTLTQTNGIATLSVDIDGVTKVISAPIVIGADGTDSTIREQANIHATIHDYGQSALVTRTHLQRPHQQIAYERFLDEGAIAMLPLMGMESATIVSAKQATIQSLMALSDADFVNYLQQSFGYRLGRFLRTDKRHVYPLRMVRADKEIAQSVLLLGNAAHTLHPIAAQGLNLALYEVEILVEGVLNKRTRHEVFTAEDLAQVASHIRRQQRLSIGLSHQLTKVFDESSPLALRCAAQLCMMGLDVLTPIKKKFIENITARPARAHLLSATNHEQNV